MNDSSLCISMYILIDFKQLFFFAKIFILLTNNKTLINHQRFVEGSVGYEPPSNRLFVRIYENVYPTLTSTSGRFLITR